MGSILSTFFSFAHRFNARKIPKSVIQKEEEFNSSVESVTVTFVQESQEAESGKLEYSVAVDSERESLSQSLVPQVEPNSFSYKQPLTKRKSKPELRVYCPLTESCTQLEVHEFIWKYGGKQVFLAGNFNNWNPAEIELVPADASCEYHHVKVELDPTRTWEFKFIVDGVWRCNLDIPTMTDIHGNTNNVIYPE